MSRQDYTYGVARIRALENSLLNKDDINQLLACTSEEDTVELLMSKGWGNGEDAKDGETILTYELDKTWDIVRELVKDMSQLDVLSYKDLHHNIKAAMKRIASDTNAPEVYIHNSFYSDDELLDMVREKAWHRLPNFMSDRVAEVYETLLNTGDGQLVDVMMDRICLESIYMAGARADHQIIEQYAEETVAVTDIKIAVRSQRTGKSKEFMELAMANCKSISTDMLIKAALTGEEAIIEYLDGTNYSKGAEALKKSLSAFECWCDNRIIEIIKPQLRNSFTIGPIFAYIYARENEIKSVRNILMGKRSELAVEDIRERVREMYV